MPNALTLRARRDAATREIVVETLQAHPSNRAAARSLGISPAALSRHMRRLGVAVQASRSLNVAA
jgi:transcriptional regulator with GAF, ATPase, and Fis domain